MYQKLEVSCDVRQTIEHIFWILGNLPENISTGASEDSFIIFNNKTDNTLEFKVKK